MLGAVCEHQLIGNPFDSVISLELCDWKMGGIGSALPWMINVVGGGALKR